MDPKGARSEAEDLSVPEYRERFERVLLRAGVDIRSATPDDFRRVPVVASSILEARIMEPQAGWVLYEVTPPGIITEAEILARRRVLEGPPVDMSKI